MDSKQSMLERLKKIAGSYKVYYDPPVNIKMEYPCIRCSLSNRDSIHADNSRYLRIQSYQIVLIDKNSTSGENMCQVLEDEFIYARLSRSYVSDGLHHYVYLLYNNDQ